MSSGPVPKRLYYWTQFPDKNDSIKNSDLKKLCGNDRVNLPSPYSHTTDEEKNNNYKIATEFSDISFKFREYPDITIKGNRGILAMRSEYLRMLFSRNKGKVIIYLHFNPEIFLYIIKYLYDDAFYYWKSYDDIKSNNEFNEEELFALIQTLHEMLLHDFMNVIIKLFINTSKNIKLLLDLELYVEDYHEPLIIKLQELLIVQLDDEINFERILDDVLPPLDSGDMPELVDGTFDSNDDDDDDEESYHDDNDKNEINNKDKYENENKDNGILDDLNDIQLKYLLILVEIGFLVDLFGSKIFKRYPNIIQKLNYQQLRSHWHLLEEVYEFENLFNIVTTKIKPEIIKINDEFTIVYPIYKKVDSKISVLQLPVKKGMTLYYYSDEKIKEVKIQTIRIPNTDIKQDTSFRDTAKIDIDGLSIAIPTNNKNFYYIPSGISISSLNK